MTAGLHILTQPIAGAVAPVRALGFYAIVYGAGDTSTLFLPDPLEHTLEQPR